MKEEKRKPLSITRERGDHELLASVAAATKMSQLQVLIAGLQLFTGKQRGALMVLETARVKIVEFREVE